MFFESVPLISQVNEDFCCCDCYTLKNIGLCMWLPLIAEYSPVPPSIGQLALDNDSQQNDITWPLGE